MITLNYSNLAKTAENYGLSSEEINAQSEKIADFLKKIQARQQGFYEIPDDEKILEKIEKFVRETNARYSDIVVLGIGGSALGTICLRDASQNPFKKTAPRLHVIDNIDPDFIADLEEIIDYKKTLFIVITKSGETPETLSQYFYFRKKIEDASLDPKEHFVFVTDLKKGLLRKIADKEKIPSFPIPENVGGRFSVLTPGGLLPAALIGLNIKKLITGAKLERKKFLSKNQNPKGD